MTRLLSLFSFIYLFSVFLLPFSSFFSISFLSLCSNFSLSLLFTSSFFFFSIYFSCSLTFFSLLSIFRLYLFFLSFFSTISLSHFKFLLSSFLSIDFITMSFFPFAPLNNSSVVNMKGSTFSALKMIDNRKKWIIWNRFQFTSAFLNEKAIRLFSPIILNLTIKLLYN